MALGVFDVASQGVKLLTPLVSEVIGPIIYRCHVINGQQTNPLQNQAHDKLQLAHARVCQSVYKIAMVTRGVVAQSFIKPESNTSSPSAASVWRSGR